MTQEEVFQINPKAKIFSGYDDAILGMAEGFNLEPIVIYDLDKVIQILMVRDGMSEDEANEFYEYNILGLGLGEMTPMFITR